MTSETFKLLDDINRQGWDNSTWDIIESDGTLNIQRYFGAEEDLTLSKGYFIAVYAPMDEDFTKFAFAHKSICTTTINMFDDGYTIYIYKLS